jgi:hypothetical protein
MLYLVAGWKTKDFKEPSRNLKMYYEGLVGRSDQGKIPGTNKSLPRNNNKNKKRSGSFTIMGRSTCWII